MSSDKPLSHDEIWDDSALIESWNDALAEYKKYHSIHAHGGTIKDIAELRQNAKRETEGSGHERFVALHMSEDDRTPSNRRKIDGTNISNEHQEQRLPQQSSNEREKNGYEPDEADVIDQARTKDATASPHGPQLPAPVPSEGPAAMLGSVRDDGLKKLLMSWYYAGYYTGLYQGQQEASSGKHSGDSHGR